MLNVRAIFGSASLLVFASSTFAATIAQWDHTGKPGNQANTPGVGAAHVAVDAIVRGAGLSAATGSNSLNSTGWEQPVTATPGASAEYLQFGIDIDQGYSVTLGALYMGSRSTSVGPSKMGVYTSLDNYAALLTTINQPDSLYVNSAINLSALGTVSGSFDIRLIEVGNTQADGFGSTLAGGSFRVGDYFFGASEVANFQITGTLNSPPVHVPEGGSSAFLLSVALAGMVLVRRKC